MRPMLRQVRDALRARSAMPERTEIAVPPAPEPLLPRVVGLSELASSGDDGFVVFFAPEAGIVPHYIAHCVVAKTLEDRGHRTLIVRCNDVYPRCVVMDGELLPQDLTAEQRKQVCATCHGYANRMTGDYGLNVVELRELVDDDVKEKVERLIADLPKDLLTFEFDGIRFGYICGAEAAITFKSTDFSGSTPEVRRLLIWYIKGALLSYFAMRRLVLTGKVRRVVHFNEYGILLSAALAARKGGIPTTLLTMASIRGVDRRRVVLMPDLMAIVSYRNRLKEWRRWRDLRLPAAVIDDLADDCRFRISGNSIMIYSPTRTGSTDDVFVRLGLSASRKLLVAFTSSLDEVGANKLYLDAMNYESFSVRQPFRDQIEWLEALIKRVEASDDLQLVVRVHPRLGANRRESVVSGHLGELQAHFTRTYQHVRIVWPGDDVSSYDLMELADVGLSAWSSTALEMARFGTPSIIAFDQHTPLPLGDVVQFAETPEGYFALIDDMLQQPPSLDTISLAYRWTYLHFLGCSVDLGDVIPDPNCFVLPPFKSPANGGFVESVLVDGKLALEINRDRLIAVQTEQPASVERDALLLQLRRMIWFMCTGLDRTGDYRLYCCKTSEPQVPEGYDALLWLDGDFVEFVTNDLRVRRRSRMMQRLGLLAANGFDRTSTVRPGFALRSKIASQESSFG
jgi:hypothetical protein